MLIFLNNVAPSYMCDINQISHRHNTRQSDSAYVVPRVNGQGSKSFKFNGSQLWNELPTSVKHVQQKIDLRKNVRRCWWPEWKRKKKWMLYLNLILVFYYIFIIFLLYFYYICIVRVIIFYLFLGYIHLHVSLYIVCVAYPLNVRSNMEIRRSKLCDFFLVLPFL